MTLGTIDMIFIIIEGILAVMLVSSTVVLWKKGLLTLDEED